MNKLLEKAGDFFADVTGKFSYDKFLYVVLGALAFFAAAYIVCHFAASAKRIKRLRNAETEDLSLSVPQRSSYGLTLAYLLILAASAVFTAAYHGIAGHALAKLFNCALYLAVIAASAAVLYFLHDILYRVAARRFERELEAYYCAEGEESCCRSCRGEESGQEILPPPSLPVTRVESEVREIVPPLDGQLSMLAEIHAEQPPQPIAEQETPVYREPAREEIACQEPTYEVSVFDAPAEQPQIYGDYAPAPETPAEQPQAQYEESPQEPPREMPAPDPAVSAEEIWDAMDDADFDFEDMDEELNLNAEGFTVEPPEQEPEKQAPAKSGENEIAIEAERKQPEEAARELVGEVRKIKEQPARKSVETYSPGVSELIDRANLAREGADGEESLRTMQQVALLLQKEREKKRHKTPEEQRRMNEALADLLRAIGKK